MAEGGEESVEAMLMQVAMFVLLVLLLVVQV